MPTGETYKIKTIDDLCQAVNLDNWEDFMMDLTYFLRAAAEFKHHFPDEDVKYREYKWTDDGDPGYKGMIVDNGGQLEMEN